MKHKVLFFILSVCLALFISNIAFADIDLDLGEEPASISVKKSAYFTIKGGYDMSGNAAVDWEADDEGEYIGSGSGSVDVDIKSGFSFSAEGTGSIGGGIFYLGGGACYQLPRGIDESGSGDSKFNFLPLYGLGKIIFDAGSVLPFGVFHIGYNLMFANDEFKGGGDVSGGLYWGLGGGIMLTNGIQVELLYSVNRGKYEYETEYTDGYYYYNFSYTENIKYSKITISAGFNF